MSEPDAVPLPRDGEVFFDVRGDARSMRLSWYADSNVAVFSIWQGNRCTGTFRLPFADLSRMVQTLQSGSPLTGSGQADFGSASYGGYDSAGYASADYDGAGYQYSGSGYGDLDHQRATASYQAAGYSDPGYDSTGSYGENAGAGYGAVSDAVQAEADLAPSRVTRATRPGILTTPSRPLRPVIWPAPARNISPRTPAARSTQARNTVRSARRARRRITT